MYRFTTKGLIEGLISGYNATVFAYGPTGQYKFIPKSGQYIDFSLYIFNHGNFTKTIKLFKILSKELRFIIQPLIFFY